MLPFSPWRLPSIQMDLLSGVFIDSSPSMIIVMQLNLTLLCHSLKFCCTYLSAKLTSVYSDLGIRSADDTVDITCHSTSGDLCKSLQPRNIPVSIISVY